MREIEYLTKVLNSESWSSTGGSWNNALERAFCEKFGVKYAVTIDVVVKPEQVDECISLAALEHPLDMLLIHEVVAQHQVKPIDLVVLLQVRADGGPDQSVTPCYNDLHALLPMTTSVSPTPRIRVSTNL